MPSWFLRMRRNVGVPKHSQLEPDYCLVKRDGDASATESQGRRFPSFLDYFQAVNCPRIELEPPYRFGTLFCVEMKGQLRFAVDD
jgi:hypothetical protein